MVYLIKLDCLDFNWDTQEQIAYRLWCIYCSIKGISSENASNYKPLYDDEKQVFTITPSKNIQVCIFTDNLALTFIDYEQTERDMILKEIKLQFTNN